METLKWYRKKKKEKLKELRYKNIYIEEFDILSQERKELRYEINLLWDNLTHLDIIINCKIRNYITTSILIISIIYILIN